MKKLIKAVLSALRRFFLSISARLHVDAKVKAGFKDEENNDCGEEESTEKGD